MATTGASLTPIYERLSGASAYHPLSADTFSDWTMEAGDIVTVSRDDTDYASPVHSLQMTWKGAPMVRINSVGREKRDSVSRQSARKFGRGGNAQRSAENLYYEIYSEDGEVHSSIEMTASEIRTEVSATISGMAQSVIEQTATYIQTQVSNAASAIAESVIIQTSTYIETTVMGIASGVAYTVVTQTMTGIEEKIIERSRVFVQLDDPKLTVMDLREGDVWIKSARKTWNELAGETWSEVAEGTWRGLYNSEHYVWHNNRWQLEYERASVIESSIEVNRTNEKFEVLARQINSQGEAAVANLTVTANKINADVAAANSALYSTITQTATYLNSEIADLRNDTRSSITQTASAIMTSVSASNSALYSTITQTATYIMTEVANTASGLQSQITQTASSISLVVEGTGANAHIKAASIAASINAQTGTSAVKISADMIELDGDAVAKSLSGKSIGADSLGCYDLLVGTSMTLEPDSTIGYYMGGSYDAGHIIVGASVSGNTLTLRQLNGDPVTFSKATTLSGAWSSGKFTVTASPQGNSCDATVYVTQNGNATKNANFQSTVNVPIKAYSYVNSGETPVETGYTSSLAVSVDPLLQSKSVTANGTVTFDSSYIGLSSVTVNVPTYSRAVTITYAGMTTSSAGGQTIYTFNYKVDRNTASNPFGSMSVGGTRTVHW